MALYANQPFYTIMIIISYHVYTGCPCMISIVFQKNIEDVGQHYIKSINKLCGLKNNEILHFSCFWTLIIRGHPVSDSVL